MSDREPPYFDWTIDRWKLALIVILFLILLIGTLFWPDSTPTVDSGSRNLDLGYPSLLRALI